jgi:hypothetical protein
MNCSICLNSVRKTRSTRELPCGHLYHERCISDWEDRGNETCPLCRKNTAKNDFRITLSIQNLRTDSNVSMNLDYSNIESIVNRIGLNSEDFGMLTTDIIFDADDLDSLESILGDIGVSLTDVDTAVLDTH